ncbi:MAG: phosphopantothenoylcysteine decarboxylase [Novosphingobium sp.]
MPTPRILLVVGGGIAAYKACELVRTIRKNGGLVTCVLTDAGAQFVTPMTLAALSENPVYTTLWDLKNEVEMGHIQLSRQADLVVVCPATADLLAKMASGIADDLATTLLLATDKPVMAVPAMNVQMWQHEATRRNVDLLRRAGVTVMEPDEGPMACGEFGPGRLPEPDAVWQAIGGQLGIAVEAPPPQLTHSGATPDLAGEEAGHVEALEPEPEQGQAKEPETTSVRGGLGGLLASIIPRASSRKAPSLDDYEDIAEEPVEAVEQETASEPESPQDDEDLRRFEEAALAAGEPAPGGPLLATKGAAKAAPPTDREAINHEVNPNQSPPEAFEGEAAAVPVGDIPEVLDDPLEGQPDFDVDPDHRPLFGRHVLVTAGPTHEPIDPVRYIANRSSGRQGFSIAAAAAAAGARVTLVSGPVHLQTPPGVDRIDVETAQEMADAVKKALPADVAIMVAAVADWRSHEVADSKMKKRQSAPPALRLTENPDILANVSGMTKRPGLIIGFAAETDDVIENAKAKRKRKGCHWIVANDVSGDVMGGDSNTVHIVSADDVDSWEHMPKQDVARRLIEKVAQAVGPADEED